MTRAWRPRCASGPAANSVGILAREPGTPVTLRIAARTPAGHRPADAPDLVSLAYVAAGGSTHEFGEFDGRYLSTEVAGGFTGRVLSVEAREGEVVLTRFRYAPPGLARPESTPSGG